MTATGSLSALTRRAGVYKIYRTDINKILKIRYYLLILGGLAVA
jgi:hypothetical protein